MGIDSTFTTRSSPGRRIIAWPSLLALRSPRRQTLRRTVEDFTVATQRLDLEADEDSNAEHVLAHKDLSNLWPIISIISVETLWPAFRSSVPQYSSGLSHHVSTSPVKPTKSEERDAYKPCTVLTHFLMCLLSSSGLPKILWGLKIKCPHIRWSFYL